MAITKEYLEGLGLTEEQIQSIFKERGLEITADKNQHKKEMDSLQSKLTEKENSIVKLSADLQNAKTQEDVDTAVQEWKGKYEQQKALNLQSTVDNAITGQNGLDATSIRAHLNLDNLSEMPDPVAYVNQQLEVLKGKLPFLFKEVDDPAGGNNNSNDDNNDNNEPPVPGTIKVIRGGQVLPKEAITVDDIMNIEDSEQRQLAIAQNMELFE